MKRRIDILIIFMLGLMIALPSTLYAGSGKTSEAKTESTIDERKAIRKGNKLYEDKRYGI